MKTSPYASQPSQKVSEKKRTPESEQATHATEARFRQAFDNAPIGMAVIDFNFRFRRVNAALCRALDYTPAELLQQRLADITHADDLTLTAPLDLEGPAGGGEENGGGGNGAGNGGAAS